MKTSSDFCGVQGRVDAAQSDADGTLSLAGAAALVADALQSWGGEAATRAASSMTLRRGPAAAPRTGELVRCLLEAPATAGDAPLLARLHGPRGLAWEAELRGLAAPTVPVTPVPPASLPPLQLLRPMRADDCDQAGHVNVRVFMALADEATQALLADVQNDGAPLHIDRVRISFKRELFRGDVVAVHAGVRQVEAQAVHVVHGLVHHASGALACIVVTRLAPAPDAPATAVEAAIAGLRPLADDWPGLPAARTPAEPRAGATPAAGAVVTAMAVVDAWDCDATGRLSLRALVNLCSTGARQYLATIGLTGSRFHREQITVAAVDYLIEIARRPALGANLTLRTAFLAGSARSIRFAHHLVDSDDGTPYATVEIVGVMLDLAAHRSMEIPADVRRQLGLA